MLLSAGFVRTSKQAELEKSGDLEEQSEAEVEADLALEHQFEDIVGDSLS